MPVKFITTPGGGKLAILSAQEYEDMRDAFVHQRAMADYRAGRVRRPDTRRGSNPAGRADTARLLAGEMRYDASGAGEIRGNDATPRRRSRIGQAWGLARNHGPHRCGAEHFSRQFGRRRLKHAPIIPERAS
jgi:hypothetical protein